MTIQYGEVPDAKNSHTYKHFATILPKSQSDHVFLVGIAGAGGAGKTTYANNLCKFIGAENALAIDLDDYLISRKDRGKLEITGYNPDANKLHLARQHLETLACGKAIRKPTYDHRTGELGPEQDVKPKRIVIFEGVTTLYPELRELYDCSFFLDAPDETQIKSRITRDVKERGYTLEEALKLFHAVQPDYRRFVEPTKAFADIICHVSPEYVMTVTHCAERFR